MNKEAKKEYNRQYLLKNKAERPAKDRAYYARNREKMLTYFRAYYQKNKNTLLPKLKAHSTRYRKELRQQVFEHYAGGIPECNCCHEQELCFLTIDHIDGHGNAHRRETRCGAGHKMYTWLRKNEFPPGFQVLCMNCNLAKGIYGVCPHKNV